MEVSHAQDRYKIIIKEYDSTKRQEKDGNFQEQNVCLAVNMCSHVRLGMNVDMHVLV